MRFMLTEEQVLVAEAVGDISESLGGASVARAWGEGNFAPGLKLWSQLAEMGLMSLTLSEDEGGLGGTIVDLVSVFERLGYEGTPGPLLESIVLLPSLVDSETKAGLASGEIIATAAVEGVSPYALDTAVAHRVFSISGGVISPAVVSGAVDSIDPVRKLGVVSSEGAGVPLNKQVLDRALEATALANAAMLIGAGERILELSVEYANVREQFGRKIGEFQAVKHQLANVKVALTFARPLLHGAALSLDTAVGPRDVSAAKVAASKAAQLAARVGLQVHAGIGYTEELDLSIWLRRVPALVAAWGTPSAHRARVAASITGG